MAVPVNLCTAFKPRPSILELSTEGITDIWVHVTPPGQTPKVVIPYLLLQGCRIFLKKGTNPYF